MEKDMQSILSCAIMNKGLFLGLMVSLRVNSLQRTELADGIQSFDLNEKYVLEIVAIDFDDCGNKRFCDIYWDQKDIETKIVHKIEE